MQLGCRPFHGLSIPFDIDPGAYAPGFMPSPAPQAFLCKFLTYSQSDTNDKYRKGTATLDGLTDN